MKRKTQQKESLKVFDHHMPPEQLQCALTLFLQVSGQDGNIVPKDIPSSGVLMTVV